MEVRNVLHFPCLKEFCAASAEVNLEFSKKIISNLNQNFSERFSDLDKIGEDVLLFQNPFSCNPSDMPSELYLELSRPVDEMLSSLQIETARENEHHLNDVLVLPCFVYGNEMLFNEYLEGIYWY